MFTDIVTSNNIVAERASFMKTLTNIISCIIPAYFKLRLVFLIFVYDYLSHIDNIATTHLDLTAYSVHGSLIIKGCICYLNTTSLSKVSYPYHILNLFE